MTGSPTAVAIRDGRILAVGDDEEIMAHVGPGTRVIEAGGRPVVPGLIDSHIHMVRAGLTWNQNVDWSGVRSLAEGLAAIAARVATSPPGTWVCVVGGWGPGQFVDGRMPTVEELDAISTDHPIYVQYLYESAIVNSAGLAAIGMVRGAPDPPRGVFERDEAGEPTGFCQGVDAFHACVAAAGRPDFETQVEWTAALMRRFNRCGITGVIDPGGMNMAPEAYRPLYELWRRGAMTVRTRLYLMPQAAGLEREQVRDNIRHLHPGFGDEWLRLTGAGEMVSFGFFDLEGVRPFEVTPDAEVMLEELVERRATWRPIEESMLLLALPRTAPHALTYRIGSTDDQRTWFRIGGRWLEHAEALRVGVPARVTRVFDAIQPRPWATALSPDISHLLAETCPRQRVQPWALAAAMALVDREVRDHDELLGLLLGSPADAVVDAATLGPDLARVVTGIGAYAEDYLEYLREAHEEWLSEGGLDDPDPEETDSDEEIVELAGLADPTFSLTTRALVSMLDDFERHLGDPEPAQWGR
jgi:hypothetical protein